MLLLATCTPLGQVGPESWSQAPAPCPGADLALAQSPTTWFLSPAYAQEKRKNSLVDATFALHHAVLTRRVLTYTFPQVLGFLFFFLVTQNLHFLNQRGIRVIRTDTASVTASSSAFPRWPQKMELTTLIRNPSSWATN